MAKGLKDPVIALRLFALSSGKLKSNMHIGGKYHSIHFENIVAFLFYI
jgi:hypothetical protein